jgi:DNA-binding NtrC family response regulator
LLDLALGGESGLELLEKILFHHPQMTVIMMTGYGSLEDAVKAIKLGATDFIQKPIQLDHLHHLLNTSCTLRILKQENRELKGQLHKTSRIITQDTHFLSLLHKAEKLGKSELPVLILGESGTGKELLAQQIHAASNRSHLPMQHINCAAFTESLLESELFGHRKGAFTGADQTHIGVFENAHQGTLHLDEIGDMALTTQAKILRVLQEGEIKPLGATNSIHVDLRIIASTHASLKDLMEQGLFRQDLYYRLNTAILEIPPLRDRKEDIPLLLQHFIQQEKNSSDIKIEKSALENLKQYPWPGNVRQLKSAIQFALAVCSHNKISLDDFPSEITLPTPSPSNPSDVLGNAERETIERIYRECQYNKKKTAEVLNITRATLYKRLEKYGLQ